MSINDKYVLYGGPIPLENKIQNSSIGEFLLEKLMSLGDSVLMVSVYEKVLKKVTLLIFNYMSVNKKFDSDNTRDDIP